MEERLIQLEMKISYLEKDVGDLDGFVRELSGELTALRKKVDSLEMRLGVGPGAGAEEDAEEDGEEPSSGMA